MRFCEASRPVEASGNSQPDAARADVHAVRLAR